MYSVIFVNPYVGSREMRKEIKLIVPFFNLLPEINTSQVILLCVISIVFLQIKELPSIPKTGAQLSF